MSLARHERGLKKLSLRLFPTPVSFVFFFLILRHRTGVKALFLPQLRTLQFCMVVGVNFVLAMFVCLFFFFLGIL